VLSTLEEESDIAEVDIEKSIDNEISLMSRKFK